MPKGILCAKLMFHLATAQLEVSQHGNQHAVQRYDEAIIGISISAIGKSKREIPHPGDLLARARDGHDFNSYNRSGRGLDAAEKLQPQRRVFNNDVAD